MRSMGYEKAFWEKVVESADSIIVVLDTRGKIKLFNRKAREVTGYQAREILGKAWVKTCVPPDYRPRIQRIFDSLLKGEAVPQYAEYPILSKQGKEIPVAWDRTFIKDPNARTEAILSVGHDLSLTRTMEEERRRTQTILESIADGVFTVGMDMRITSFNRAAAKITGFNQEEAIGQRCSDILRTRLCAGDCPLRISMETGKDSVNLETDILDRQNREVPISFSTAVRRDAEGHPVGGILVFRDLSPIAELKKELQGKYSFQDIISRDKSFLEIFRVLPDIAASDATVLITGESGTGKELVATALHNLSPRRDRPLIKVNCGALPETLLESELFGYKRGAFTDARQDKPGRFQLAEGGTIFLDEVGDLSPGTQVKLLRVLESKEYEPLGGTRTEKADVRILAATNKDLGSLAQSGGFREDLFYRLNLFPIEIPPLRERPEDIPLLLDAFVARFNRTTGKNISGFSPSALEILLNHPYPGNVRELQNIVEHAFILCKAGHIGVECLPAYLKKKSPFPDEGKPRRALEELEKEYILETLRRHGGKVREAAKEMGVHRATLWRKLKRINAPADGRKKSPPDKLNSSS